MQTKDKTTDEAIIMHLAASAGEMKRRDLTKAIGHRKDFQQALNRLERTKRIEMIQKRMRGRKPQNLVRMIGQDDALLHGVGFVRIGHENI